MHSQEYKKNRSVLPMTWCSFRFYWGTRLICGQFYAAVYECFFFVTKADCRLASEISHKINLMAKFFQCSETLTMILKPGIIQASVVIDVSDAGFISFGFGRQQINFFLPKLRFAGGGWNKQMVWRQMVYLQVKLTSHKLIKKTTCPLSHILNT